MCQLYSGVMEQSRTETIQLSFLPLSESEAVRWPSSVERSTCHKPDDLSLVPETHLVEGESWLMKPFSGPYACTMAVAPHTQLKFSTLNKKEAKITIQTETKQTNKKPTPNQQMFLPW